MTLTKTEKLLVVLTAGLAMFSLFSIGIAASGGSVLNLWFAIASFMSGASAFFSGFIAVATIVDRLEK